MRNSETFIAKKIMNDIFIAFEADLPFRPPDVFVLWIFLGAEIEGLEKRGEELRIGGEARRRGEERTRREVRRRREEERRGEEVNVRNGVKGGEDEWQGEVKSGKIRKVRRREMKIRRHA